MKLPLQAACTNYVAITSLSSSLTMKPASSSPFLNFFSFAMVSMFDYTPLYSSY